MADCAGRERFFSDASVRHLQSLITDVALGVGHEPRSLFISTHEADDTRTDSVPALKPTLCAAHGDDGRFRIRTNGRREGIPGEREGIRWQPPAALARSFHLSGNFGTRPACSNFDRAPWQLPSSYDLVSGYQHDPRHHQSCTANPARAKRVNA
jgi:hypothetical protein